MTRRIVFVDVDDTLTSRWGHVPASARAALARARANGHLVVLCTGRTGVELPDLLGGLGYDGVVGSGGAYVEYGGRLLYERCFPLPDLAEITDRLLADGYPVAYQTYARLLPGPGCLEFLEERIPRYAEGRPDLARHLDTFLAGFAPGEPLVQDGVYKISLLTVRGTPLDRLRDRFAGLADAIRLSIALFGDEPAELLQPGVTKATGMAWLLDRLGADRSQTVAFGDSANDVEMLEFAALGIAMGNATAQAKAAADEVTAAAADDGLAQALERHGLA